MVMRCQPERGSAPTALDRRTLRGSDDAMKRITMTGTLVAAVLLLAAQAAAARWLQTLPPSPSGVTTWRFSAVSWPSSTWCMAVGATDSHLLAETRASGAWTIVTIP